MNQELAKQIADLLNKRNSLLKIYTAKEILSNADEYVYIADKNQLITCAQCKKVQWYQCEICHVSVNKSFEGQGYGSKVLELAEQKAKKGNARLFQATIKSDNEPSIRLFTNNGYYKVNEFFNANSGNTVFVFQKINQNDI